MHHVIGLGRGCWYRLAVQPGYLSDCVYVQQRVHRVDLEARCFVMDGQIVEVLYTRFARIDRGGE